MKKRSPLCLVWPVWGALVWLGLYPLALSAQNPRFEARSNARQVVVDGVFDVSFVLYNADGSNFQPPRFTGFDLLSGPGTSVSTTIINGQVSKEIGYTYSLRPRQTGVFTIGPASIEVGGRVLKTQPLSIEVVKGQPAQAGAKAVFIRAEISQAQAYVGQQLMLDYKIYYNRDFADETPVQESEYPGFFTQEIRRFDPQITQVVIDGQPYYSRILRRVALYPQQANRVTIDPYVVQVLVDMNDKPRPGSIFYRPEYQRVVVQSEPLEVTIKDLPPPPPGFGGAVGRFKMSTHAQPTTLTTDDALTLTVTITGVGDSKRVTAPDLSGLANDYEVFEPRTTQDEFYVYPDRVESIKKFTYLLTPRRPGGFVLQPAFTYFDIDSLRYVSLRADAHQLTVRPGTRLPQQAADVESPQGQAGLRPARTDIRLRRPGPTLWGSWWWWGLAGLPLLALGLLLWLKRRQQIEALIDPVLRRQQQARQQAQQRLTTAEQHRRAGASRAFYDEVSRALLGYITDKLQIPPANLSKDHVRQRLEAWGVDELLIQRYLGLLQTCEMALFAGKDQPEAMADTYTQALDVLAEVESALKPG